VSVTINIEQDLNAQQPTIEDIEELQIDRAYLLAINQQRNTSDYYLQGMESQNGNF